MNCPNCNEPLSESDFDVKIDSDGPPDRKIRVTIECVECGKDYFSFMSLHDFLPSN